MCGFGESRISLKRVSEICIVDILLYNLYYIITYNITYVKFKFTFFNFFNEKSVFSEFPRTTQNVELIV